MGLVTALMLYGATALYSVGQGLIGVIVLAVATRLCHHLRHGPVLFGPLRLSGVAAVMVFIAFPVIYTVYLGFTNYSSFNLLTKERAIEVLLSGRAIDPTSERPFAIAPDPAGYRLFFPEGEGGFLTGPAALDGNTVSLSAEAVATPPAETLPVRDLVKLRKGLSAVTVTLPDGSELKGSGLRTFASVKPEFELQPDGKLRRRDRWQPADA